MKNPRPVGWIGTVSAGVAAGLLTLALGNILTGALPSAASVWSGVKSLPGALWAGLLAEIPVPAWVAMLMTGNLAYALVWWWRDRGQLFRLEYPEPGSGQVDESKQTVLIGLAAAEDRTFTARQLIEALEQDEAAVNGALEALRRHGLAMRFRHGGDFHYELTAKGRRLVADWRAGSVEGPSSGSTGATPPSSSSPGDESEMKRERLAYRRQTVAGWRAAIRREKYDVGDDRSGFLSSSAYSSLRLLLSEEARNKIEALRTTYVGGARGENSVRKQVLLDEVARIERDWGLL